LKRAVVRSLEIIEEATKTFLKALGRNTQRLLGGALED